MRFGERIYAALEEPFCDSVFTDPSVPAYYDQLASMDDMDQVEAGIDHPGELPAAQIAVDSHEEFRELWHDIQATGEAFGPGFVDYALTHEVQHINAARHAGAPGAWAGAMATTDDNRVSWRPFWVPARHTTTVLAMISGAGAPMEPSDGDLVDLQRMGVGGGVEQAGHLIGEHNREVGYQKYLLPLGFSPGQPRWQRGRLALKRVGDFLCDEA
ncbi:MAG TPA: hypothetical protein VK674_03160 [Candidatus Limnocylindria bacterium]|nr:hypothetical protein [Candidatus Limnocylindria bacterium]